MAKATSKTPAPKTQKSNSKAKVASGNKFSKETYLF